MALVMTWVDHPYGCSNSDTGWWIIDDRCPHHRKLAPKNISQHFPLSQADGHICGPFKP